MFHLHTVSRSVNNLRTLNNKTIYIWIPTLSMTSQTKVHVQGKHVTSYVWTPSTAVPNPQILPRQELLMKKKEDTTQETCMLSTLNLFNVSILLSIPTCYKENGCLVRMKFHLSSNPWPIKMRIPPTLLLVLGIFVLVCGTDEGNAEVTLLSVYFNLSLSGW